MEITIKDLELNEKAEITGYFKAEKIYRDKIISMGLARGTHIKITKIAPLGDPVEIEAKGFKISLRKNEAAVLKLKRI